MLRQSGWRVDPLSCCHPAPQRTSPSSFVRWVLRPVRALCCVPLRYLFLPLICHTLRHKHTLPLSIYLTPFGNSSLRPAPKRRVCAQREKGGESALVIICNTRGMKRGCFPGGSSIFLKLRFISLFSLTFWPSWEAVVSQWRPNRRIPPPQPSSSFARFHHWLRNGVRDCPGPSPSIIVDHTNPISYY